MLNISDCVRLLYFTPHWPCKVHTHIHQPIPIPQYLFTTNTTATTTNTHTHTHTPTSRTHPNTPHSHPPHTHTPTYIHYPKHPNLHPIPPQTQNTSLQHFQSFQPPPIYLLHSCTVTITLHQHINTILNIRTLIKVPFGSYRTNHHNAIRQPLSSPKTTSQVRTKIYTQQHVTQLHPILTQLITNLETRKPRNPRTALV